MPKINASVLAGLLLSLLIYNLSLRSVLFAWRKRSYDSDYVF